MKTKKLVFIVILCFIRFANMSGQDTYQIYLHTDRSYYLPGESVLFKAFILADQNNGSYQINDTLHVALIDQEGIEVSSEIFPVNNSLLTGNIKLPDFLTEGNYILIAYTLSLDKTTPEKIFSRVIEIRNYDEFYVVTDFSLTDTLYRPGSQLTAKIRFSGKDNKPLPAPFTYQLTGSKGVILSGKNEANSEGMSTFSFLLPQFEENERMKLLMSLSYKGTKSVTGVVIPTSFNWAGRRETVAGRNMSVNNPRHLNIRITPDKLQYEHNDNVSLDISVTDDKGNPVKANLSVSASSIFHSPLPIDNDNIESYVNVKSNSSAVKTNTDIKKYFAQSLLEITQSPGKPFIVQEKNNPKKLHRKTEPAHQKQYGYSSDRNIFDILMQIKPYHLENGKIIFGINSMNSINNLDGSIIVVDGVKMGTDASILNDIPVPDIARITASTNVLDIQRYSAMNSVGIIEITMKKTADYINKEENAGKPKSNTLYWGPEIITDSSGKASVSFNNNNKSAEVLISVVGIAANGLYGSGSAQYTVK